MKNERKMQGNPQHEVVKNGRKKARWAQSWKRASCQPAEASDHYVTLVVEGLPQMPLSSKA